MKEILITSLKDFVSELEQIEVLPLKETEGKTVLFRGQSDFRYKLQPSLLRSLPEDVTNKEEFLFRAEMAAIELYLSSYSLYKPDKSVPNGRSTVPLLIDMQHYSFPTRLLDWSYSPFIALFFAVNQNIQSDGALYIWKSLNWGHTATKMHLYDLRKKSDALIKEYGEDSWFLHIPHDQDEAKSFVTVVDRGTFYNDRIYLQKGCFTVSNNILLDHEFGIKKSCGDSVDKLFIKFKVPAKAKPRLLLELEQMNISSGHLFPGLDGLGKQFSEKIRMKTLNFDEEPSGF